MPRPRVAVARAELDESRWLQHRHRKRISEEFEAREAARGRPSKANHRDSRRGVARWSCAAPRRRHQNVALPRLLRRGRERTGRAGAVGALVLGDAVRRRDSLNDSTQHETKGGPNETLATQYPD
jgi:hypothetical protein